LIKQIGLAMGARRRTSDLSQTGDLVTAITSRPASSEHAHFDSKTGEFAALDHRGLIMKKFILASVVFALTVGTVTLLTVYSHQIVAEAASDVTMRSLVADCSGSNC
jgi:hypothetical protein